MRGPIDNGLRRNITGPGANGRSHDRRGAVRRLPGRRHPGRRQDRDRAGRRQLPVERLVGVRRLQPRRRRARSPSSSYLEKVGIRLAGRGARREVHVRGAVRATSRSTRWTISEPLDIDVSDSVAAGTCHRVDVECMRSTSADTITGVATGAGLPDDGAVDAAAQAGLRARQHPVQPGRPQPQHRLGAAAAQAALAVAGCFVVYSATRIRTRRPVHVRHPPGDLRHRRRRRDGRRDGVRLRVAARNAPVPVRADGRSCCSRLAVVQPDVGEHDAGRRRRPDPGPAGRVRQVHRAARPVRVPQRGAHTE